MMTVTTSRRKIPDTGLILIIISLFSTIASLSTENECSGVSCKNGGSFEYSDGHCVCRCQTGYFGLLCEIELVESAWPDGPYALLTARAGCPEAVNRGWRRGFVHFSMATPISIRRSSGLFNQSGSDTEVAIFKERGANIEGPFSSAYVRLNFCFKLKTDVHLSDQLWPDGNYSIFGTEDGCPEGFIEEVFTLSLPAFRSWMKDGYLPHMVINMTTGEIMVKLCRRTSLTSNYSARLGTFVMLKNSDTSCDAGNSGYDVIEETLEFLNNNADQTERRANNSISFCHFWNPIQYKHQPCSTDKHHCGRGHCIPIPELCDGTADCLDGNDENDEFCAQKCSHAEFHCGKGVCAPLDLVCDFNEDCPDGSDESDKEGFCKKFYSDYFNCVVLTDWLCDGEDFCIQESWLCDGWKDCLDGSDEEWQTCLTFKSTACGPDEFWCTTQTCVEAARCNRTEHCLLDGGKDIDKFCKIAHPDANIRQDTFFCGDGHCVKTISVCDGKNDCDDGRDELPANCYKRCLAVADIGNYYCPRDGCVSHQAACSELSECGEKYEALECLHELGLGDGTIHDFQISASSFKTDHGPSMVRPTLSSWCPTEDDIDPFLQIDFRTPNLVEGLIVYNRFIISGTVSNNEYLKTITPVGCRSFAVSYAMIPDSFQLYMDQIDFALDYSEPQTFRFLKPFLARFIRVHILSPTQGGDLCLQLEVIGCRGKGYLTVDCEMDTNSFWVQYPQLKPLSSQVDLPGNYSLNECQAACKSQFERCTAVDFIQNQTCRVYTRKKVTSFEDTNTEKTSTTMFLQICLKEEETEFFSALAGEYYNLIDARDAGEINSLGYPFSYQSRMMYLWKISSVNRLYVRITFVDISLHQSTTGKNDDCDVIIVMRDVVGTVFIDSSYNGRTPTIPTSYRNATVTFKACQRYMYADESTHGRGFLFLYQFDRHASNMRTFPAILYSPSLLGFDWHFEHWIRIQGYTMAVLTFIYFNVPCSDGFVFIMDEVAYCNIRRPRKHSREFDIRIDFDYSGNLSLISPEGFSAIVSLPPEEYKGPVILTNGGKRIPVRRKEFPCGITGVTIDFQLACDGVEHCADGSDEKACDFINTEPVYTETGEMSLEGMEICLGELQKCFVYFTLGNRKTWNEDSSLCNVGGYTLPNIHNREEMEFIRKWMQTIHMYTQMSSVGFKDKIGVHKRFMDNSIMFYVYIGLSVPLVKEK